MNDVDLLASVLAERFDHVSVRHDYGWPGHPTLSVLDCVLSLNRHYDRVVYPRVVAFSGRRPDVVALDRLEALMNEYDEPGQFCKNELNYNDVRREQTLRGVVHYLLAVQSACEGGSEYERLHNWAVNVRPGDYAFVGVKGFGLAGFQYMRMLFGVQTTKPDVHIIRFVSEAIGKSVNDIMALTLLEHAARQAALPLREVDGAIWEAGARNGGNLEHRWA